MKKYLLVFDDGSGPSVDLRRFVDSLDADAEMYTLDGHVCFIKSELTVSELSDRFVRFAGSSLFFITDVSSSEGTGRMIGPFWDFIQTPALPTAAE